MTEGEWLACEDPVRLLAHLNRPRGDRRLLLYAVGCCRAHAAHLVHSASHEALGWAEGYADGTHRRDDQHDRIEWASEGAAFRLESTARSDIDYEWDGSGHNYPQRTQRDGAAELRVAVAYLANAVMSLDTSEPFDPTLSRHERCLSVALLRDIFGNPFRPVVLYPMWRTNTAVALARTMYDARDFGAMPILADALQDAGCDTDDILNHCRSEGTHVRGCWVCDLVLGL